MAFILLVSGLLPYDSGKTRFSISFIKRMKERGIEFAPYKPVSAHSIYTQAWSFEESVRRGYLVGGDALLYEKELGLSEESLLRMNPIDLLLSPLKPPNKPGPDKLKEYLKDMENQLKMTALIRITGCESGDARYFLLEENIENSPKSMKEKIIEFADRVGARKVGLDEAFGELASSSVNKNLDRCLESIKDEKKNVLIESFSNSIYPYFSVLNKANALVIVAPGKAYLYNDTEPVREAIYSGKISTQYPESHFLLSYVEPYAEEELLFGEPLAEGSPLLELIIRSISSSML